MTHEPLLPDFSKHHETRNTLHRRPGDGLGFDALPCHGAEEKEAIENSQSPDGRYVVVMESGPGTTEGKPDVRLSLRSAKGNAGAKPLCTLVGIMRGVHFPDSYTLAWSPSGARLAVYFGGGHGHSVLILYRIQAGVPKEIKLPHWPGYQRARKAVPADPSKEVTERLAFGTFEVSDLAWKDDDHLSANVGYYFMEAQKSVALSGQFCPTKSGSWTFQVKKTEILP